MKKDFFYNFLLTSSNLLFPLLTFPYLSRILGAEGIGICSFIQSYAQNFAIIAALGIPLYGIREISKVRDDKAKRSRIFFELLSIHSILTVIFLIIYFISIFNYADFEQNKKLAIVGSGFIFLNVFSIEWLFTGLSNFKYITIRSVIIRVISIIFIFLLVKTKDDFTIYFLIIVLTFFFTALLDMYSSIKFISWKISLTVKGILVHLKPVTFLGIYMVLTSIYSVLPTTLLGFLSTKLAVGYYYGANRIIRMVISIFTSLITVMIPRLNSVVEKEESGEYLSMLQKTLSIVITFGIPITFFVFLVANPLVMLLAGKNFINSIFVIQIMSPIILIVAFAQIFVHLVLNVNRKDKEMMLLAVLGMIIGIVINLVFIPRFAERATGVSQLLSELLVTLFSFFLARRILHFHFPTRNFILNLMYVIPFAVITYLPIHFFTNNFLILLTSGFFCFLYFIVYQLFFIKDKIFFEMIEPYLVRLKIKNKK